MSESIITRVARLLERADRGLLGREVASALGVSRMVTRRSLCSLGKKTPPIAMCNNGIWTWTGVRYEGSKAPKPLSVRYIDSVYAAIASHHGIRAAGISEVTGVPLAEVTRATIRLRINGDICFSRKKGWQLPDDEGCAAFVKDNAAQTGLQKDECVPEKKNVDRKERKGLTAEDDAWMKLWHPANRANRFAARVRGEL